LVGKGGVIREIWIDLKHLRGWMEMSIFYPCSILSMVFHCSPLLSNTIYNINTYIYIYMYMYIIQWLFYMIIHDFHEYPLSYIKDDLLFSTLIDNHHGPWILNLII
jgi:hypothetical protein